MSISDWSSDVCSSDLLALKLGAAGGVGCAGLLFWRHYRLQRRSVSILCAAILLIFGTHLAAQLLREIFDPGLPEIGRAAGRERVCQDVWISVAAASLKKQKYQRSMSRQYIQD